MYSLIPNYVQPQATQTTDSPDYPFPGKALAAAVSAIGFATLLFLARRHSSMCVVIGELGCAISASLCVSSYGQNRGKAEFNFAKQKMRDSDFKTARIWMEKAKCHHYPNANFELALLDALIKIDRLLSPQTTYSTKEKKITRMADILGTFLTSCESKDDLKLKEYFLKLKEYFPVEVTIEDIVEWLQDNPEEGTFVIEQIQKLLKTNE